MYETDFDFEKIYNQYKNMVWAKICTSVNDEQLRFDIMQEVFLKLYTNLDKISNENVLKRWLTVVTKSTLIDMNRKEDRFKKCMEAVFDDEMSIPEYADIPLESAVQKSVSEQIRKTLTQLKPIHYEVIIMHYFLELSPKEIAVCTKLSVNTVYSRLARAKEILYEKIVDYTWL